MANVIRHKRGTSDPSASDFSDTAELLVNTTDGGLFTKDDSDNVVEIGGGGSGDKISEGNTEVETIDTGSDGHIKFTTEGTEAFRIDNGGKLLLGITSSSTYPDGFGSRFQIQGTTAGESSISITRNSNDDNNPYLIFAKSRGTAVGSNTALADNDKLGQINFVGADGSGDFNLFAQIRAEVDGTPGNSDAPGRLTFFTTADSGVSNVERLRITSTGAWAIEGASNYGTSGQVLTSNGNDAPTWQNASGGGGSTDLLEIMLFT